MSDGFTASRSETEVVPQRIVVTVDTSQEFGFRSLIECLRGIAPPHIEVLWQTGSTDVTGLDIDETPWLPAAESQSAMENADVVIFHAGVGSALASLMSGRCTILVPRHADRGEFNDDHQEEITARLESRGLVRQGHLDTLQWADVVEAARWSIDRVPDQPPLPLSSRAGRHRT